MLKKTPPHTAVSVALAASLGMLIAGCEKKPQSNAANNAASTAATPAPDARTKADQGRAYKRSALYLAAIENDLPAVEVLLKAGSDPNEYNEDEHGSFAALHAAARHGNVEVIQLLISHGAEVDIKAQVFHEATPLHWAARSLQLDAVKALVEAGADVTMLCLTRDAPQTAAQIAAERGSFEIVQYLQSKGG